MTRFLPVVWPIIHPDVMTTFNTLWHLDSRNLRNINDARIVLQPKSAEVASVRYYHPISLIHIFGKLFSKVLANRLAQKLGELVQANQSAFIKGTDPRQFQVGAAFSKVIACAEEGKPTSEV
jgi:hypothetical protein